MNDSELWQSLEEMGYQTGHLVAQCPRCGERCMIGYVSAKGVPPRCRVCLPHPAPRVVVLSDRLLVEHKKPGQRRSVRQLGRSGAILVSRPYRSATSDGGWRVIDDGRRLIDDDDADAEGGDAV